MGECQGYLLTRGVIIVNTMIIIRVGLFVSLFCSAESPRSNILEKCGLVHETTSHLGLFMNHSCNILYYRFHNIHALNAQNMSSNTAISS